MLEIHCAGKKLENVTSLQMFKSLSNLGGRASFYSKNLPSNPTFSIKNGKKTVMVCESVSEEKGKQDGNQTYGVSGLEPISNILRSGFYRDGKTNFSFKNKSLHYLLEFILEPFNINVENNIKLSKTLKTFYISTGDTVESLLSSIISKSGLKIVYSSDDRTLKVPNALAYSIDKIPSIAQLIFEDDLQYTDAILAGSNSLDGSTSSPNVTHLNDSPTPRYFVRNVALTDHKKAVESLKLASEKSHTLRLVFPSLEMYEVGQKVSYQGYDYTVENYTIDLNGHEKKTTINLTFGPRNQLSPKLFINKELERERFFKRIGGEL